MMQAEGVRLPQHTNRSDVLGNPLDTSFVEHQERSSGPPAGPFHRWLSLEQIRKMQRMRRQTVLEAMLSGELPYEQRGRIRYARLSDVLIWEEKRLRSDSTPSRRAIAPELADLAG
ncbi:MAG: hypothetical protein HY287_03935 [Planctomycetes bacterium]|nr:hypothetical protein [Planctomycetota bacterium]MBI3833463.1 hypothetical protein [Planctomycetota bacterium]